ncbi:MAG: PBP1A family penicillin-binding protein [Myxococcota bacterium]|nr:PBP1A family penicillin-binding protein [Myxococcota bacterium]
MTSQPTSLTGRLFSLSGWLTRFSLMLAAAALVPTAWFALSLYQEHREGLPAVPDLDNYRPPSITRVLAADGTILAEFAEERRMVVPYQRMPQRLVQAFVAAEDKSFFDHDGVDLKGIVRAALVNLKAGRTVQGASTITQQLAKQLLVRHQGYSKGRMRTLARKIREAILARRLEYALTKEDILYLYLNEIYLGHGAYGVQAASQAYFSKNVESLSLGEMTLLAGLPPAPSRFSPLKNPESARTKQGYVLKRMIEEGYISVDEAKAARKEEAEKKVLPRENLFRDIAPYFTEQARQVFVERMGEEELMRGGWTIQTTLDISRQIKARTALQNGIEALDRRMGYWGPEARFEPDQVQAVAKTYTRKVLDNAPANRGEEHLAIIANVERKKATAHVGDELLPIHLSDHRWMRTGRRRAYSLYDRPTDLRRRFQVGDLLRVRFETDRKGDEKLMVVQDPLPEGALVSQDLRTDYVVALAGGYDFDRSQFNCAFQACRQPGSAFKPIIFSAGLALGGRIRRGAPVETITVTTQLSDAPIVRHDFSTGVRWKPANYDRSYTDEVSLRRAMMLSMNLPTIDLFERVVSKKVVEWANRIGIEQELNVDASIALGSHCVIPWELLQVYALFGKGGQRPAKRFITRIESSDGKVLHDEADYRDVWASRSERIDRMARQALQPPEQVIAPGIAYIMTYLMRQVVQAGTATRARIQGVPLAGKTGTTNDNKDAWFVGYSPHLVTGVWIGERFNLRPLGRSETGGRTAAPIWKAYMTAALDGTDPGEFSVQKDIEFANVDAKTGRLGGNYRLPYMKGTKPTQRVRVDNQSAGVSDEL